MKNKDLKPIFEFVDEKEQKQDNQNATEALETAPEDNSVTEEEVPTRIITEEDAVSEGEISLSDFSGSQGFVSHEKPRKGFLGWWKARKTWQKALMISGISFILVFAILVSTVFIMFDYNYQTLTDNPNDLGFENVLDKNIINVALFGIDTRSLDSFKGNSDSIMILSLNTITKKVKIISVMRDSFVPMTYDGKTTYGKINSAYAKGGPELAIKTINTIFGLDISEYATVNFFGMVDIIDALGGIEAELTEGEVTRKTNVKAINFCIDELCSKLKRDPKNYRIYEPGKQTLNGVQAVAYSRIRYVSNIWGTNNDYGRTDRQRYVMEQLFNKALTIDKSQYIKLAKSLIPCSETSLSYKEIMGLAFDILLESPTFEQTRMPQEEFLMNSPGGYGSVVYYDLDYAKELIHAFIYQGISPEDFIEENGVEKYDWYRNRFSSGEGNNYGNNGWHSGQSGNNSYVTETPSDVTDSQVSDSSDTQSSSDKDNNKRPGRDEDDEDEDRDESNTSSDDSSDTESTGSEDDDRNESDGQGTGSDSENVSSDNTSSGNDSQPDSSGGDNTSSNESSSLPTGGESSSTPSSSSSEASSSTPGGGNTSSTTSGSDNTTPSTPSEGT